MPNLDYQNRDDARVQKRSEWMRRTFGVSQRDAWEALAREINAVYAERGWFGSGKRVDSIVDRWQITLDTYTIHSGNSHQVFTRLRAPFVNPSSFRFRIYRKSIFSDLGKFFGMQDIEIGDPFFDDDFIIQSRDAAGVTMLLANPRIRQLLAAQPRVMFEVRDDEGWFGKQFPHGVDELRYSAHGIIKDIDRLRLLFDLFTETLHQLCAIGAAEDAPPGVQL